MCRLIVETVVRFLLVMPVVAASSSAANLPSRITSTKSSMSTPELRKTSIALRTLFVVVAASCVIGSLFVALTSRGVVLRDVACLIAFAACLVSSSVSLTPFAL